jgi:four helix bundle protein
VAPRLANVEEAIGAFSKKDFIYKMAIAYKEARESSYRIKLLMLSNNIPEKSA